MDVNEVIVTLDYLLKTTIDGKEGFRACENCAKSPRLKSVFHAAALRCDEGAAELRAKIEALGGEPTEQGTVGGALNRGWMTLKSSIGMDDHAILVSCEAAEDAAMSVYEMALEDDLPADIRAIVERQYADVVQNHDLIRELRDQSRAA
jgi:uncharacterized protein (TIGR02284 family)